jgi:uncharacterized alpha-E superfamily protein
MISRVAEHCCWLSRYLERVENTARILEVNQSLLLDFYVPLEQQWNPILIISGIHDYPGPFEAELVQAHMTWDTDNPCSIVSSMGVARENARVVRETISAEMWNHLNTWNRWLQSGDARQIYLGDRNEFYARIRRINQLFHGITDGTMTHDEPWEFLQLGKHLERACQTARILDVKYHTILPTPDKVGVPVHNAHWVAILNSCSAYEPYHKLRRVAEPEVAVPEFLLFHPTFPRSVRHSLLQVRRAAHAISGHPVAQLENEAERTIHALVAWLHLVRIEDLLPAGLHDALTSIVDRIHEIGDAIYRTYFDVRVQIPTDEGFDPSI